MLFSFIPLFALNACIQTHIKPDLLLTPRDLGLSQHGTEVVLEGIKEQMDYVASKIGGTATFNKMVNLLSVVQVIEQSEEASLKVITVPHAKAHS
ncbi:unnamed protein product [Protopolystoma xenopodis]|uniref:Uncharacterized protein n=1 Tax=Protopolystoma xenopodis TaxID=117903 RepID=A0A448X154_9PLAT|nr:unnamed protein product [Protopolystoma xenopodis]